jgi:hypothetical protein
MLLKVTILLSLAIASAIPAAAQIDPPERKWKKVPGHPKVFVDMNSVRPVPRYTSPCLPTRPKDKTHAFPCPPIDPYDTRVDLWLNGHPASTVLGCDLPPNVTISDADGEYHEDNQFIGYIPQKQLRSMICALRIAKFGKAKTIYPK